MNFTCSLDDRLYFKEIFVEWSKIWIEVEKLILQFEVNYQSISLKHELLSKLSHTKRFSSFSGLTWITKLIYEMETAINLVYTENTIVNKELIDCFLNGHYEIKKSIKKIEKMVEDSYFLIDHTEIKIEIDNDELIIDNISQLNSIVNKSIHCNESVALEQEDNKKTNLISCADSQNNRIEETKETFFFQLYELIDEIDSILSNIKVFDSDDMIPTQLSIITQNINKVLDKFINFEGKGSTITNRLIEMNEITLNYELLVNGITNKTINFDKTKLDLSHELVNYLREVIEVLTLDHEPEKSNSDLNIRLVEEINNISQPSQQVSDLERENITTELGNKGVSAQSIRVSQDKLDKMMNMISELLITKNAFTHVSDKINAEGNVSYLSKEVKQIGSMVNRISDELQKAIMSMRMVEINTLFQKMPRIIRDVSQNTGKKMKLVLKGETTEIDKTIIEQISDPIVHLIRNAADHGIENREIRLEKGKEESGTITLRAYNKDKHVCIEIEDDGKGIDDQFLKQKAISKGFITEEHAEKLTHNQLMQLIFLPGFSTAEQITELSGRGVGMDVVKSNIEKINGKVSIFSERDKGTKIVIYLPLTLAVSRGLTVNVLSETYIIPIDYVAETVKININDIHEYNGKKFVYMRGEVIGIEWLSSLFLLGECEHSQEEVNTVILSSGQEKLGLVVDKFLNEQEFVIKTLNGHLASIPGISGSTLLGSGQVVLIINPLDLIDMSKNI